MHVRRTTFGTSATLLLLALAGAACVDSPRFRPVPPGNRPPIAKDASMGIPIDSGLVGVDGGFGFEDATTPGADATMTTFDATAPGEDATSPIDAGFIDTGPVPDTGPRDSGITMGPSAGCGRPHSSGVSFASITVAGQQRTYVLAAPSSYDPNHPYSLMFGWHGSQWQGDSYRQSINLEQEAGGAAIALYPDGLTVSGGSTGWIYNHTGRDVQLFDALLAFMLANYCIDQDRIFSFGRSAGAYFVEELACVRGDVFRGIASMSGGGPLGTGCTGNPVPAWLSHSTDDGTVPVANGRSSRDWYLRLDGCPGSTRPTSPSPCVSYTGCASGLDVVWCETPTGGHEPPPFAPSAVWAFFNSR